MKRRGFIGGAGALLGLGSQSTDALACTPKALTLEALKGCEVRLVAASRYVHEEFRRTRYVINNSLNLEEGGS